MTEAKTYSQTEFEEGCKQAIETGRQLGIEQASKKYTNLLAALKGQRNEAIDQVADLQATVMELNERLLALEVNAKPMQDK